MTELAYAFLFGGFCGWFLNSWARGNKLKMHRWNRTREFERARRM